MNRLLPCARPIARAAGLALSLAATAGMARASEPLVPVSGHAPALLANARAVSRVNSKQPLSLALSLPLRNKPELNTLLKRLYDKNDPLYRHYLTAPQFTAKFGPTQEDYDHVAAWAKAQGLTVHPHSNRLLLDVQGNAGKIESAFHVRLNNYAANGTTFFAPNAAPTLPASVAGHLNGIIGLHNAWKPRSNVRLMPKKNVGAKPKRNGSGPNGGFLAPDIKIAYLLDTIPQDGTGQTIALYELDGFLPEDIAEYRKRNKLPEGDVEVRLVGNATGEAGYGSVEVVLDIDMAISLAPKARIIVYEGDGTLASYFDTYNVIASENRAQQISSSWYLGFEKEIVAANQVNLIAAETQMHQEMAAQGQTFFVASGDSGPYDFSGAIDPQYPASDPWATSVGGTKLTVDSDGTYVSESVWNTFLLKDGGIYGGAGGSGISTLFGLPNWQAPFVLNPKNKELSTVARNYPDVSANAADDSPYDIYLGGYPDTPAGWYSVSGTSAAAPLWAGYIAQANQFRAENDLGRIGFFNPMLYDIASKFYYYDFNDVFDKSTNGSVDIFGAPGFTALFGFDLATGLGSMYGGSLFQDLVSESSSYGPPAAVTVTPLPGDKYVLVNWTRALGASKYVVYRFPNKNGSGLIGATNKLTFKDTTVTNGVQYTYNIVPVGKGGQGDYAGGSATPNFVKITGGPSFSGPMSLIWATNVLSDSKVIYGDSPAHLTQTVSDPTFVLSHKIKLPNLTPKTKYYYQAVSYDGYVTTKSPVRSFTTP